MRQGIDKLCVLAYIAVMSETTDLMKRLKDDFKLSQSEIARRTGIPQPRVSRWTAGEVPDAADDALRLRALVEELAARAEAERAEG